ncbi:helix-turn-helix transcriptional regulator [Aneurinibacillus terranovensis]|uniref:helix-turn-helix transcriptional regulator n=1 Tax=Aneurinibacillus terranovensis TaxID=278991 RepID=UPI00042052A6|nr:helix-turn-helix transcriptional regulator [Aneurinibacillus terranovensis]
MKNENLTSARKAKNLTQEELAKMLGCQKGTVSNWENGHSNPSLADAFKVAEILGSDINVIFSDIKVQDSYTNSA